MDQGLFTFIHGIEEQPQGVRGSARGCVGRVQGLYIAAGCLHLILWPIEEQPQGVGGVAGVYRWVLGVHRMPVYIYTSEFECGGHLLQSCTT